MAGAECVDDQGGVERFVVEVAHGQGRGVRAVYLEGALVEVGQRLTGDVPVAGGLGRAAGLRDGQWFPNTVQVRPRWVRKLTCTISRVALRRITTWKNTSSAGASRIAGS